MGSSQSQLLQTANIRGALVVESTGSRAELPYARRKRERAEQAKRERERKSECRVMNDHQTSPARIPMTLEAPVSSAHKFAWQTLSAEHNSTPIKSPLTYQQTPDYSVFRKAPNDTPLVTQQSPAKTPLRDLGRTELSHLSAVATPLVYRAPVMRMEETKEDALEFSEETVVEHSTLLVSQETRSESTYSHVFEEDYESNDENRLAATVETVLDLCEPLSSESRQPPTSPLEPEGTLTIQELSAYFERTSRLEGASLLSAILRPEFTERLLSLLSWKSNRWDEMHCRASGFAIKSLLSLANVEGSSDLRDIGVLSALSPLFSDLDQFITDAIQTFYAAIVNEGGGPFDDSKLDILLQLLEDWFSFLELAFAIVEGIEPASVLHHIVSVIAFPDEEHVFLLASVAMKALTLLKQIITSANQDDLKLLMDMQVEAALTQAIHQLDVSSLETVFADSGPSEAATLYLISLECLAALVHTSFDSWPRLLPPPLLFSLQATPLSTEQTNVISARIALRQKLLENIAAGIFLNKGTNLAQALKIAFSVGLEDDQRSASEPAPRLRLSLLRLLVHVTADFASKLDESMMNSILTRLNTYLDKGVVHRDSATIGPSMIVIGNLLRCRSPSYFQLMAVCNYVATLLSNQPSASFNIAGCQVLAEIWLTCRRGSQLTQTQRQTLIDSVCAVKDIVITLILKFIEKPPTMTPNEEYHYVGSKHGLLTEGAMDAPLMLLGLFSEVGQLESSHVSVNSLVSTLCRFIAVSQ